MRSFELLHDLLTVLNGHELDIVEMFEESVRDLTRRINETREVYKFPALSVHEICQMY